MTDSQASVLEHILMLSELLVKLYWLNVVAFIQVYLATVCSLDNQLRHI